MAFLSIEQLEETPEFKIVSSIFQHEASPSSAVHDLLRLTHTVVRDTSDDQRKLGDHLDQTFTSVIEIAGRFVPSDQSSLVAFLLELGQQEILDQASGNPLRYLDDEDSVVWRELPGMSLAIAEDWHHYPKAGDQGFDRAGGICYTNKMGFLARLTGTLGNTIPERDSHRGLYDWSSFALGSFIRTFEQSREHRATDEWCLRESCYWLIYAADIMWANVKAERYKDKTGSRDSGRVWGGAYLGRVSRLSGFDRERWGIWVRALNNEVEQEDAELRGLVVKALAEAARVEDQSWRITEDERYA